MRKIDIEREAKDICSFIKDYCKINGFDKVVIGISGGIDSAVSAALAVRALGRENVLGVLMPSSDSHPASLEDGLKVVAALQIWHTVISIGFLSEPYFDTYDHAADRLRKGNWKARLRMMILYDLSAKHRALVLGTSNRTELMVGYFTQFGDGACALEPIGNLYKTEVRAMAEYLMLPDIVITKAPTADLWDGQTDEEELGMCYETLDEILYQLTEQGFDPYTAKDLSYSRDEYAHVLGLISRSEYKRKLPALAERKC